MTFRSRTKTHHTSKIQLGTEWHTVYRPISNGFWTHEISEHAYEPTRCLGHRTGSDGEFQPAYDGATSTIPNHAIQFSSELFTRLLQGSCIHMAVRRTQHIDVNYLLLCPVQELAQLD